MSWHRLVVGMGLLSTVVMMGCKSNAVDVTNVTCAADVIECVPCTPNELKCSDAVLKRCKPDGNGLVSLAVCASESLCVAGITAGACVSPTCSANERRCEGATLRYCSADRDRFESVECASADACTRGLSASPTSTAPTCAAPACTVGGHMCQGNELRKCTSVDGFTSVGTCVTAGLCAEALKLASPACPAPACAVDERRCVAPTGSGPTTLLQRCNAERTGFEDVATCGSAALCGDGITSGACGTASCTAGDKRCEVLAGTLTYRVCNDPKAYTDTACSMPTSACDPAKGCVTAVAPLVNASGAASPTKRGIQKTEVTRVQYASFALLQTISPSPSPALANFATRYPQCAATSSLAPDVGCLASGTVCRPSSASDKRCDDHPQVCVSWCQAAAYCEANGMRLCGNEGGSASLIASAASTAPTLLATSPSDQWTRACTSGDARTYSYLGSFNPSFCNVSVATTATEPTVAAGSKLACTAESTSAWSGTFDLIGNVAEWQDACDGASCLVRGGAAKVNNVTASQATCTSVEAVAANGVSTQTGFRCCEGTLAAPSCLPDGAKSCKQLPTAPGLACCAGTTCRQSGACVSGSCGEGSLCTASADCCEGAEGYSCRANGKCSKLALPTTCATNADCLVGATCRSGACWGTTCGAPSESCTSTPCCSGTTCRADLLCRAGALAAVCAAPSDCLESETCRAASAVVSGRGSTYCGSGACANVSEGCSTSRDCCVGTYCDATGKCLTSCPTACTGGKTCQSSTCACPPGQTDCSGTCVDLKSSPGNCGACGATCSGTCQSGGCVSVVLSGRNFSLGNEIAVDATHLYWTETGKVVSIPLAGGTPVVLATGGLPGALAIDGSFVYFAERNSPNQAIKRVPLGGGTVTTLASLPGVSPVDLAINATHLYYISNTSAGPNTGAVVKIPLAGGAPITLASSQPNPQAIAIDGSNVYWTGGDLMTLALTGGTPTSLFTGLGSNSFGLTSDGSSVFWTNSTGGKLSKGAAAGTSLIVLASSQPTPAALAMDATTIYWGNRNPTVFAGGSIRSVGTGGGGAIDRALGQADPVAITVDAKHIYWLTGGDGTVWKATK